MKKITYLLTVFIVLLSLAGLTGLKAEGSDMTQVAVISVTKIGGLRNTNNLVVYFAKDYPDGSNQNQWGYEAPLTAKELSWNSGLMSDAKRRFYHFRSRHRFDNGSKHAQNRSVRGIQPGPDEIVYI